MFFLSVVGDTFFFWFMPTWLSMMGSNGKAVVTCRNHRYVSISESTTPNFWEAKSTCNPSVIAYFVSAIFFTNAMHFVRQNSLQRAAVVAQNTAGCFCIPAGRFRCHPQMQRCWHQSCVSGGASDRIVQSLTTPVFTSQNERNSLRLRWFSFILPWDQYGQTSW